MNKLYLSPAAQRDLVDIKAYITEELENPKAAVSVVSRITKKIRLLREYAENIEEAKLYHIEDGNLFYIDDYENKDDFIAAIIKSMNAYETEKYCLHIDLESFFGKHVAVYSDNGKMFFGKVIDYLTAEEDESEFNSIIIRPVPEEGVLYQIYENQIHAVYELNSLSENNAVSQQSMIDCPVCGKYKFLQENDYDICPYCNWENDGLQMDYPDEDGGANQMSLNEARIAWTEGRKVL